MSSITMTTMFIFLASKYSRAGWLQSHVIQVTWSNLRVTWSNLKVMWSNLNCHVVQSWFNLYITWSNLKVTWFRFPSLISITFFLSFATYFPHSFFQNTVFFYLGSVKMFLFTLWDFLHYLHFSKSFKRLVDVSLTPFWLEFFTVNTKTV